MTDQKTPQLPSDEVLAPSPLTEAKTVTRTRKTPVKGQKVEPTMRALRRILGDEILDIFPEGLTDDIDQLFTHDSANQDAWHVLEFESADERNDMLKLMRAYAECAGEAGYTIRQNTNTDADVLEFRVTVRRGSGDDSTE